MEFSFWFFTLLILYIYFGYPLLLLILAKLFPIPVVKQENIAPTVSIIISAFNEEKVIARKVENSLSLDYPVDKLEIIIGSDGSTDNTNEIVGAYDNSRVQLVTFHKNRGKSSVQNDIVKKSQGEILVFTDATGMLQKDALHQLVRNFADERVGCVGGAVHDRTMTGTAVTMANDVYWRYEVLLRGAESRFGSLAMASGSLFALRRNLFKPLSLNVGDDFVLPLGVAQQGYLTIFEPMAISADELSSKSGEKFRQKARIVNKDLRGLLYQRILLNPFSFPRYALSLWSHKLLRWLVPFWLIGILITNVLLSIQLFYAVLLVFQVFFYLFTLTGFILSRFNFKVTPFYIPFYFCLLNLAAAKGVWDFLWGKKVGKWRTIR